MDTIGGPILAAKLLTAVWFCAFVVYVAVHFSSIVALPPDSFGDMLAGWFAPPAFLWLVVGYFFQAEAFRLQVDELKHQVESTQTLAAEAKIQNEQLIRQVAASVVLSETARLRAEQDMLSAVPKLTVERTPDGRLRLRIGPPGCRELVCKAGNKVFCHAGSIQPNTSLELRPVDSLHGKAVAFTFQLVNVAGGVCFGSQTGTVGEDGTPELDVGDVPLMLIPSD